MESKPKIYDTPVLTFQEDLEYRLEDATPYHSINEMIANNILNMMSEKSKMYGGNLDMGTLHLQATRAYYEGVGRKTNRIPAILARLSADENDESAKAELVDTYVDIAGYAIIALNDIKKYIGD